MLGGGAVVHRALRLGAVRALSTLRDEAALGLLVVVGAVVYAGIDSAAVRPALAEGAGAG